MSLACKENTSLAICQSLTFTIHHHYFFFCMIHWQGALQKFNIRTTKSLLMKMKVVPSKSVFYIFKRRDGLIYN